jgi:hypothetical protein
MLTKRQKYWIIDHGFIGQAEQRESAVLQIEI